MESSTHEKTQNQLSSNAKLIKKTKSIDNQK